MMRPERWLTDTKNGQEGPVLGRNRLTDKRLTCCSWLTKGAKAKACVHLVNRRRFSA